jgi:hypothetical protein
MMAARRYLTAQYDWTGLSRLLYRSAAWEIILLALVAVVVVLLFTLPESFGFGLLRQSSPEALSTVMLDRFAPKEIVHRGDLILAGLLAFFLLTNAARMFLFVMRGEKIRPSLYVTHLYDLIIHGLTQVRWKDCQRKETVKNWLRHVFLVTGYGTMFILVVVFLPWFQVEDVSLHWTSLFGYYGTLVLAGGAGWILLDRIAKRSEMHKFSTALSGILLHLFRLLDLAMPTYLMYVVHLSIAVPMLAVEVPFGKWAHLLYRPLAIYLTAVKENARELTAQTALAEV